MFGGIIFAGMSVGEALSYLGDYGKATLAAGKIFKLIYYAPPIDAYSEVKKLKTPTVPSVEKLLKRN